MRDLISREDNELSALPRDPSACLVYKNFMRGEIAITIYRGCKSSCVSLSFLLFSFCVRKCDLDLLALFAVSA